MRIALRAPTLRPTTSPGLGRFTLLAAPALVVILLAAGISWPIPFLAYSSDPRTGLVTVVDPGSAVERAGVLVGDRVVTLYGRPPAELHKTWNGLAMMRAYPEGIPITVERGGELHSMLIARSRPTAEVQLGKIQTLLVAVICWLTGYVIGVIRRHEYRWPLLIAGIWMLIGVTISVYNLSRFISVPLRLLTLWLIICVISPLIAYTHLFFPARFPDAAIRTGLAWVGLFSVGATLAMLGAIWLFDRTVVEWLILLSNITSISIVLGMGAGLGILRAAYRRTTIARTRRQIDYITLPMAMVAGLWCAFFVTPILLGREPILPGYTLDALTALIPIGYLLSSLQRDLIALGAALRRICAVVLAVALLGVVAMVLLELLPPGGQAVPWAVIGAAALFPPLMELTRRIIPAERRTTSAIDAAIVQLPTSLDLDTIAQTFHRAIATAYHNPLFALYLRDGAEHSELRLMARSADGQFPDTLGDGPLSAFLGRQRTIVEWHALPAELLSSEGRPAERALAALPIALFGPIVTAEGQLAGVACIGIDRTLDPYGPADLAAIRHLIATTTLAWANSAAYQAQRRSAQLIAQLYQERQRTQDQIAAEIARDLHDDVINLNLRLNIAALQQLVAATAPGPLRDELALVLSGEQGMIDRLRLICDRIHPAASDDHLGLPGLIRQMLSPIQRNWSGQIDLVITGEARALTPDRQRAALQVVKEATVNAVKHAPRATAIVIALTYPTAASEAIQIDIRDNGVGASAIQPVAGHWGLSNMQLSATMARGSLHYTTTPTGTQVRLLLPSAEDTGSATPALIS